VNPREYFQDYSADTKQNIFNTWDKIFDDVDKYFTMCSWMNDIYG
jgi:hypothetical protein